jgi:methionyl-tRNA synthetase
VCGNTRAYGDQCENCGTSLSPDILINPHSTLSGAPPVKRSTRHWYLPLDRHEAFLRQWILEEHKDDWRASVVGQCKSWIDGGLQPRAVTRDLDWGIKVPLPQAEGKVLYVWFDAPIGYVSATRQWALDTGKDWKPYWYDKDTKLVHFIGKDNIVFHCLIFPIMLKLHGNILPANVPANEFLNLEGDKMSTSRGWSVEMEEYIDDFIKKENGGPRMADSLRYYLTTIAPETKDSDFTWKGFQEANNSELVAKFGNFVHRTFVLMHKLCNGKVPPLHQARIDETDRKMMTAIGETKKKVETQLEAYRFRDAQFEVMMLSDLANKYMQKKEPWIVARTLGETPGNQELIDNCLHICLQVTANLAILMNPFLPFTAKKMLYLMKVVEKMLDWENAGKLNLLSVGYSLRAPELLFRPIEDSEVEAQVEKLVEKKRGVEAAAAKEVTVANGATDGKTATKPAATSGPAAAKEPAVAKEPTAAKPTIVYDDFAKLELRVGTILNAEKVEKADKLLKLLVDLGTDQRTIVSGIAQHFEPSTLVGRQVVVVANLAPRKMRGIESNGMILMAEDGNGKLHFINPEDTIAPGSGVS